MGDIIDQAQDIDRMNLAAALSAQAARAAAAKRLEPAGHCHNPNCCDDFESGSLKLFCGPACAEEHQRINNR